MSEYMCVHLILYFGTCSYKKLIQIFSIRYRNCVHFIVIENENFLLLMVH